MIRPSLVANHTAFAKNDAQAAGSTTARALLRRVASPVRLLVWNWGRRAAGPLLVQRLAPALAADGRFDVHLSASRDAEIYPVLRELDLPMLSVSTYRDLPSFAWRSLLIGKVRAALHDYVRQHGIQVVLSTMPHLWEYAASHGLSEAGIARLTMVHDAELHPGERNLIVQAVMDHTVRTADHVAVSSRSVGSRLMQRLKLPEGRVSLVPPGVLTDPVGAERRVARRPGPLRLLFFGRIRQYKGLHRLIAAVAALRARGYAIELTIAGQGGPVDLSPLDGDARYIAGWVPETMVNNYFADADLVVLPYLEASQSGVIPTAQAWGLPVVVTPVGGLVEQVVPDQTGVVAENCSVAAIGAAIERFIREPGLYSRCAAGAATFADTALDWSLVSERIGDLIVRLAHR